MPVDKSRYPADWDAISLRIRERDGWCCKWCGVPHNAVIRRLEDGESYTYYGQYTTKAEWDTKWARATPKLIRVVLTVAHHPDPDPQNCTDANLQSLCQRCHNRVDAPMRAQHAAATRKLYRTRDQLSFWADPTEREA
jgi:5-methylcytosine-specific restriction endonuclease McrA